MNRTAGFLTVVTTVPLTASIALADGQCAKPLDGGQSNEAFAAVEEASRDERFSVDVAFNVARAWHDPSAVPMNVAGATAADDTGSECPMPPGGNPEAALR